LNHPIPLTLPLLIAMGPALAPKGRGKYIDTSYGSSGNCSSAA